MCGAPEQQTETPAGIDIEKETVIYGVVSKGDSPIAGAYVQLLDRGGEFTAEVVTSATGNFRFFAGPGTWTLSVLHKDGSTRQEVYAHGPGLHRTDLALE
jgi:hypothetical protein